MISLAPAAPFDFDLSLGVHAGFASQVVERYSPGTFERVFEIAGALYLVRLRNEGTVDQPRVVAAITPAPGAEVSRLLGERISWILGQDLDLLAFYRRAEAVDPVLTQIAAGLRGLRPPRSPDPFEALIVAISEQLTSLSAASTLRGRLVRRYGRTLTLDSEEWCAFPSPRSLASAREDELRALGFTGSKASCMLEVARRVAGGTLDLRALFAMPFTEVMGALGAIRGIGRWTVAYFLSRGVGRYEAIPEGDVALKASISRAYRGGETVNDRDVRAILEPFGPLKSCAASYLIYDYALKRYGDPRLTSILVGAVAQGA